MLALISRSQTSDPIVAGINPATGEVDPFYALDGAGAPLGVGRGRGGAPIIPGVFTERVNNVWRSSEVDTHEFTLTSNFDGPFNYVAGFFFGEGEDPFGQWRIEKSTHRPGLQGQQATAARQYQFLESN